MQSYMCAHIHSYIYLGEYFPQAELLFQRNIYFYTLEFHLRSVYGIREIEGKRKDRIKQEISPPSLSVAVV